MSTFIYSGFDVGHRVFDINPFKCRPRLHQFINQLVMKRKHALDLLHFFMRELSLLHQTAVLAQSLRREGTGRQAEKKLAQTEEIVDILLAQHEALAVAAALFKALDPRLILLDSDADAAVRKTYTLAGDSAPRLRVLVIEEVKQGRPGRLAAALEAHRRKQRQHMTRLSNARRHFAAFFYQHIPLIGAL